VVCGPGVLFGNWDPKRGHWMTCHHVGEELVWEVAVPIPAVPEFSYKYAVVDEQLEVVKWESETHTITLPDGLESGAIIDIFDQWQVGGGGGKLGREEAQATRAGLQHCHC
jgi:4-alpha-glucanotransferase